MTQGLLNSIGIAAVAAFLAFLATAFWRMVRRRELQDARVAELERKISVMEAAVTPISAAMLEMFVKKLTHIHTPELDALLAKLRPYTLTKAELRRMKVLLLERTTDPHPEITEEERLAAAIMPKLIEMVQVEAELPPEATDVVMVSIPKDVPK